MNDTIMELFEKNKLGADDSFRFHCTQCGKCCIHREDILLNAKDLFFISKKLACTPIQIIKQYCEMYIGKDSRIPVVRLLPKGTDHHCPLLRGRRCSVHDVKPVVCGLYPLGRAAVPPNGTTIPDEWHTEYFFLDPNCGNGKRSYTVREWLAGFHIPVEDPFYTGWHQISIRLKHTCRNIEDTIPSEAMFELWNMIAVPMYLSYDTSKDFEAQFEKNVSILQGFCQTFENYTNTRRIKLCHMNNFRKNY